jgi:Kip1 ubiquitination-promoting complex protein 1
MRRWIWSRQLQGNNNRTTLCAAALQIGWATLHCPFTAEEGVGDAADSYAVDGKRQR